ncbi:MAG: UDP-N-acetyl-D-mannosamine dehydrogenase [Bacteroidetes bacterium]|nr:MAG: UDP-N-acetyl-D-mannosamine dehydrogenase [Bacteroidota bacterium]
MMGLGYIGLPTAALIAKNKINVLGIDVQQKVVDTINKGKIHIVEPDLDGLVKKVVDDGTLRASTKVEQADAFLIAVPTPFKGNHIPDISYVESATNNIIPHLKKGDLFIIESTSPVGTTEKMTNVIYTQRPELKDKIYISYCPERVLPGNVIYELENNDRVIGGINEASTQKAIQFYRNFVKGDLHPSNARTAEMVKLTENASRDVQIAFANELSLISKKANINVWDLIKLANRHPRVNILQPGTGVGGHCIAVDPWFIVADFEKEARIIKTAREINNYKTEWVIERIKNEVLQFKLKHNKNPKVACLGLAFKPNIDDLRESPAKYVAQSLKLEKEMELLVAEPNIENSDEFEIIDSKKAIDNADIVAFLVGHKEYKTIQVTTDKIELDFCGVRQ